MKPHFWLVALACALSCSSRDQSLGETHPSPHPIINPTPTPDPDPTPTPDPDPNPNPDPNPDPDPNPNPDPNPTPTTPPCEDFARHALTGSCLPMSDCKSHVLSIAGYECPGALICCDNGVGCGPFGCGNGGSGGSGGSVMSPGGEGGETLADGAAGAGGKP